MKTLKSLQKNGASFNLITLVLLISLFSGCSKDETPTDNVPSHVGTYILTSISSNFKLDPNVSGQFNDNELIDNISCESSLTLNADNSFEWKFLRLNQSANSLLSVITNYDGIECNIISGNSGQFEINGTGLSFISSFNNSNAIINENLIEAVITAELVIKVNGLKKRQRVNLNLTYEK